MRMRLGACVRRSEHNFWNSVLSFYHVCVPGIKLRLLDSVASVFIHSSISLALSWAVYIPY